MVKAPIGTGGMGVVYRSRDTKLDRDVALKVLPEHLASHPKALSRFEAEAKSVAALSHPGIVAIHDFGRIDGVTFAITELLEGETLRTALVRGALPAARALDIATQVAEALAEAHKHGFVHRDLKPENIFLTPDGRAKVLDFGLAVRSGPFSGAEGGSETSTDPALEPAGNTPGTAPYMSPEHARGLSVDAPSDQFSLGVVLYEMLAGVRPFQGKCSAEALSSVLRDEPPSLSDRVPGLPDPVRWIVDRCLRKQPDERYASTRDLAHDLRDCAARIRDSSPPPAPGGAGLERAAWRRAALLGVLGFLALAFLAGRWAFRERGSSDYRALVAGLRVQRVTDRTVSAETPTLSPSGHEVAFVQRSGSGDTEILVKHVDGGRPINVTGDLPGENREPSFSPDGTLLAFWSSRDGGGLFVVERLGGSARRLTTFGHDPAWFPDGRRIVFATTAARSPYARLGARSELWTVDLATGATKRLYGGDAMQPAVSPRGLRVAFWALRNGGTQRDVATISLGSGSHPPAPVFVTDDPAYDWSPFWSDDGRYLCFGTDRGGSMNLWRVRIDEESGEPLAPPEPLTVPARNAGPFRESTDGRLVVYQAGTSSFDLERVQLDHHGIPTGTGAPLFVDSEWMGEPRLSPSGDLVAFSSWRGGEDLWVIGTDGRGLRRITAGPFRDRSPSFSADGRSLHFHSDRSGTFGVWKVLLDGSGLAQVARRDDLQPFRALASPDGRFLVLQGPKIGAVLLPVGHPAGAAWPDPLPPPEKDVRFEVTSFSPDGRTLAGHGVGPDETYRGIWLYDVAARRYERLARDGSCPHFAFGGKRVYYLRQKSIFDPAAVALIDVGSRLSQEILPQGKETAVVSFAAAPDGTALYLVWERARSEIWLLRRR